MAWFLPTRPFLRPKAKLLPCSYLLAETSALAEELVFERYAPSPRVQRQLWYEVKFLKSWPFPSEALSALVKAENPSGKRGRDLYYLFFPYARPLPFGRGFLPAFLLYIFTHELVHMVRFARYEASYFATPKERWEEERKVHRQTKELLKPIRFIPGLPETLAYFDQNYEREVKGHAHL